MARKLAEAAHLNSEDVVVDVGCGLGIQDYLFALEFNPVHITAYNIGAKQIAKAAAATIVRARSGGAHYELAEVSAKRSPTRREGAWRKPWHITLGSRCDPNQSHARTACSSHQSLLAAGLAASELAAMTASDLQGLTGASADEGAVIAAARSP